MVKKEWIVRGIILLFFILTSLFFSAPLAIAKEKGVSISMPSAPRAAPPSVPKVVSVTAPKSRPQSPAKKTLIQSAKSLPQSQAKPLTHKPKPEPQVKPTVYKPSPWQQVKPRAHTPASKPTAIHLQTKPTVSTFIKPVARSSGKQKPQSPGKTHYSGKNDISGKTPLPSAANTATSKHEVSGGKQQGVIPDEIRLLLNKNGDSTYIRNLQRAFGKASTVGISVDAIKDSQTDGKHETNKPTEPQSDAQTDHFRNSGNKGMLSGRPLTESEKERVRKIFHLPEGTEFENFAEANWEYKKVKIRKRLHLPADAEFETLAEAANQTEGIKNAVGNALGVPEGVEFTSATDIIKFVAEVTEAGGELTEEDWGEWSQGRGDAVVNDIIRGNLGIPDQGSEGKSKEELLQIGVAGFTLGVDITPEFIEDWGKTRNGKMSGEELTRKWAPDADFGDESGNDQNNQGNTAQGSSNTDGSGSSSHIMIPDIDSGANSEGEGSSSADNTSQGGSDTGDSSDTVSDNADSIGSTSDEGTGSDNTTNSANSNPDSEADDNSTRDIDNNGDVVDMDWDSPQADSDHNNYNDSSESDSSNRNEGTESSGQGEDTTDAADVGGHYSDEADSLRENNDNGDPDTGVFTVEGYDSSTESDSLQAGEVGDVSSDDPSSSDGYAENDDGVVVSYGMNPPDDNSSQDTGNSGNSDNSDGNSCPEGYNVHDPDNPNPPKREGDVCTSCHQRSQEGNRLVFQPNGLNGPLGLSPFGTNLDFLSLRLD